MHGSMNVYFIKVNGNFLVVYIELVNHVGHMLMLFVMLHSGQFWIKKLQF